MLVSVMSLTHALDNNPQKVDFTIWFKGFPEKKGACIIVIIIQGTKRGSTGVYGQVVPQYKRKHTVNVEYKRTDGPSLWHQQ